jgi:hypothetical protein
MIFLRFSALNRFEAKIVKKFILPEAWRKKTFESGTSFGGENYGDEIEQKLNSENDS